MRGSIYMPLGYFIRAFGVNYTMFYYSISPHCLLYLRTDPFTPRTAILTFRTNEIGRLLAILSARTALCISPAALCTRAPLLCKTQRLP
jgi:hypothetical protein